MGAGRPSARARRARDRALRLCRRGDLGPALFQDAPDGEFPLTLLFKRAQEQGRLHGLRLEGLWMHVGTPDAVLESEQAIRKSAAEI